MPARVPSRVTVGRRALSVAYAAARSSLREPDALAPEAVKQSVGTVRGGERSLG
jgi:hypothetical protein